LQFNEMSDPQPIPAPAVPLQLPAGSNTVEFGNPAAYTPDFDRIIVAAPRG
jgi:hypothetical protein